MSVLRLTFQDGRVEEHPLGSQLRIRLEVDAGGEGLYAGGTYSLSELREITLPAFEPPAVMEPPKLKEVEYDLSAYSTDGVLVGPEVKFKSMAWDDSPEPEPAKRKLRKIHAPEEAA